MTRKLARYRPLGVRLYAPVTVTNRLPCELCILLEPEAGEAGLAISSPRELVRLAAFSSSEVHLVHLLGPTRISLWLDGDTYETARMHAHVDHVVRPQTSEPKTQAATLHPPHQPHASRRVRLTVSITSREAGSCAVSVAPQHWVCNNSSLPLDIYEGRTGGGVVLHAHTCAPRPFSLSHEAASAARVGAAVREGQNVRMLSTSQVGWAGLGWAGLGWARLG